MTATEPTNAVTGVPFTMNGIPCEATHGELLIEAAERNGVHIPRFCYHPRMTPVGMCRMCLVEVDTGRGPSLQPSCMLPVTPDMKVNTESAPAKAAQDGVLELLLINHPLDCPVCDKGGECPLQDNTYAYGPGESRFVEEKRHYEKPIAISELVYLDRERCILCDRCTRFSKEVAGDPLIHFIGRGADTQVNTFPDHPFSSYFSGNTVQICPVGALTAEPYRFKARPWDLAETESTSTVDATGARVVLQSSRDRLVRVLGVDSDAVNWSWLSDKDRFSYEAMNSEDRLRTPLARNDDGNHDPIRWVDAIARVGALLDGRGDRVGVLGGARLPVEGQYAWSKLLRDVAQVEAIDAQLGDGLPDTAVLGLPRATIADAATAGGVVVLIGADPKEELPTLFLRLRHAATQDGASIIELTPRATSLLPYAAASIRPLPGTVGLVAKAMAAGDFSRPREGIEAAKLENAARLIGSGRPVTVILGRANLAEDPRFALDAVRALQTIAPDLKVLPALRRGNIMGALELGLTPGIGTDGSPLATPGLDATGILRAAVAGTIDTLVLLGADPLVDHPDRNLVTEAFDAVETIISVDLFRTASSSRADVVLPAAGFGEVDGSFVNIEGRLSPLAARVTPPGQARADWMIALEIAAQLGGDLGFASIDELRVDLSSTVPAFAGIDWAELNRIPDGPLLVTERDWTLPVPESVVAPAADGYGLRLVVDRKLWDLGTTVQQAPSLANLADSAHLQLSPGDFGALGVERGASVTIELPGGTKTVSVQPSPMVAKGTAHLSFRLAGFDAGDCISSDRLVTDIRVTAS
jgi:NADH-quinone oxidoreductase subunit G